MDNKVNEASQPLRVSLEAYADALALVSQEISHAVNDDTMSLTQKINYINMYAGWAAKWHRGMNAIIKDLNRMIKGDN